MWEFNPVEPRTLKSFFGATHEGIWKLLFKDQKSWPMETEDVGLNIENLATPVSINRSEDVSGQYFLINKNLINPLLHRDGQQRRSGSKVWLRCPKTQPIPS